MTIWDMDINVILLKTQQCLAGQHHLSLCRQSNSVINSNINQASWCRAATICWWSVGNWAKHCRWWVPGTRTSLVMKTLTGWLVKGVARIWHYVIHSQVFSDRWSCKGSHNLMCCERSSWVVFLLCLQKDYMKSLMDGTSLLKVQDEKNEVVVTQPTSDPRPPYLGKFCINAYGRRLNL